MQRTVEQLHSITYSQDVKAGSQGGTRLPLAYYIEPNRFDAETSRVGTQSPADRVVTGPVSWSRRRAMASSATDGGEDPHDGAAALQESAGGKRRRAPSSPPPPPAPPGAGGEESSRRLFQKLWTDADEIAVLQGFWEFTSRRGTARADYQHDTGSFYDEIRGRLGFDFSRSQLVEKLRRLKKKYRNTAGRMAADRGFVFRSPHERAAFEIARKIWNPVFARGPDGQSCDLDGVEAPKDGAWDSDHDSGPRPGRRLKKGKETEAVATPSEMITAAANRPEPVLPPPPSMPNSDMADQSMRSCFSPLFNEILRCTGIGHGVTALSSRTPAVGERWKQQQILELEVYLKRLELLHDHIKSKLEELKSESSS
ncbi:hypothetical protein GW17_00017704 [Ensete ventricosum]|nr:hypothetical protein GW17_00017704 [Ensete ventricosum]